MSWCSRVVVVVGSKSGAQVQMEIGEKRKLYNLTHLNTHPVSAMLARPVLALVREPVVRLWRNPSFLVCSEELRQT